MPSCILLNPALQFNRWFEARTDAINVDILIQPVQVRKYSFKSESASSSVTDDNIEVVRN